MTHLVKVPGIIISASTVRVKTTHITIQCRNCRSFKANLPVKPGLDGYTLPRKCDTYVGVSICMVVFINCVSN